jgi:tryptophan synthase alpha chain
MKKINAMFKRLAAKGEKALIPYVTAGDPDLATTRRLVLEMARQGADLIELGIPFSDPLADGPTIQAACQRALKQGVNLPKIIDLVQSLRRETEIPLVLMGYYNPILSYGLERLARDAARDGVNGFIIPDLPGEEARDWHRAACDAGVAPIFLAAPTSGPERIRKIGSLTRGFLYYVSVTGITGTRTGLPEDLKNELAQVRKLVKGPLAVGFGISTPAQVADLAPLVDGVVVGSAIVHKIASGQGPGLIKEIGEFVAALKAPLQPQCG